MYFWKKRTVIKIEQSMKVAITTSRFKTHQLCRQKYMLMDPLPELALFCWHQAAHWIFLWWTWKAATWFDWELVVLRATSSPPKPPLFFWCCSSLWRWLCAPEKWNILRSGAWWTSPRLRGSSSPTTRRRRLSHFLAARGSPPGKEGLFVYDLNLGVCRLIDFMSRFIDRLSYVFTFSHKFTH